MMIVYALTYMSGVVYVSQKYEFFHKYVDTKGTSMCIEFSVLILERDVIVILFPCRPSLVPNRIHIARSAKNQTPPEVTDIYVCVHSDHQIKSKCKTRVYHREGRSLHAVRC